MEIYRFSPIQQKRFVSVFTKPQPIKTLPQGIDILKSILATTVKSTDTRNIWQLGIRHCVNGKTIKNNEKYGPTFAPTISPESLIFQLAYSAAFDFQLQTGDCFNAIQCTYKPDPTKRIWCYLPPYYIQWWNSTYKHDPIDPTNGPFAMQAAQNIQGTPHAGNRWKRNLDAHLTKHGYTCNNVDKAFYTYHQDGELNAMLSTTVDDFLQSFKTLLIRDQFFQFMGEAFDVTTPGLQKELSFLSLRIYQSQHVISVDQTQHIYKNILSEWSPTSMAFLALDYLMSYLHHHLHESIFYPKKPISPDELVTYTWLRQQQTTYTTKSTCIYHIDAAFANILPDQRSMQSSIGFLNGVAISWSCNIQSTIAVDSIDAETKAFFYVSKKACALKNFLSSTNLHPVINTPPHIYADNCATIGLIKTNKLTFRSRHLEIPVAFTHDRYTL